MSDQAILNEKHEVVLEPDFDKWGKWYRNRDARTVAQDRIGPRLVSTVFLGVDYSSGGGGPPLWFETMIFPSEDGDYQDMYETWDQAVAGHAMAVAFVKDRKEST